MQIEECPIGGALIADDMGLGKTVTALLLVICLRTSESPLLLRSGGVMCLPARIGELHHLHLAIQLSLSSLKLRIIIPISLSYLFFLQSQKQPLVAHDSLVCFLCHNSDIIARLSKTLNSTPDTSRTRKVIVLQRLSHSVHNDKIKRWLLNITQSLSSHWQIHSLSFQNTLSHPRHQPNKGNIETRGRLSSSNAAYNGYKKRARVCR